MKPSSGENAPTEIFSTSHWCRRFRARRGSDSARSSRCSRSSPSRTRLISFPPCGAIAFMRLVVLPEGPLVGLAFGGAREAHHLKFTRGRSRYERNEFVRCPNGHPRNSTRRGHPSRHRRLV